MTIANRFCILIFIYCPVSDCGSKQRSHADAKLKCNEGGTTPVTPCLKPLNNKKHFIIHTPERDKVNNVYQLGL